MSTERAPCPLCQLNGSKTLTLPPYGSLQEARWAIGHEFPHHTSTIKQAGVAEVILLTRYQMIRRTIRFLALQLASIELALKRRIGFSKGVEIPGVGILFWTSERSRRRSKTNWMQLVKDLGVTEETLEKYQKEVPEDRRFYLKSGVKLPADMSSLHVQKDEQIFDEEF